MSYTQKNQEQDFLHRKDFIYKKNGLCKQYTHVEESAINLSQKRNEHYTYNKARQSSIHYYLQPRKHQQPQLIKRDHNLVLAPNARNNYNTSATQKIHSVYPDGVTLINLNGNGEPGVLRTIPQCHPHLINHLQSQFHMNPTIDLHIPLVGIDSPPYLYHPYDVLPPQTFQNLNNLKIDLTVDRSNQIKEESTKKDMRIINFQDTCVLLDVLVTRIKWNFQHMLNSINTHAKISINDYWRDEGHLKFKLCLTDVVNIIEEIKKLNSALFVQCHSPKELKGDELTHELEAFIKFSRKMFVTEMHEALRNEYVQYCEDFFNNQLKVLFLEHKKKYRVVFERILTENYRRSLKSIYDEDDCAANIEATKEKARTKTVESATQTFADALNTKCTKEIDITKQVINNDGVNSEKRVIESATQTSEAVNGVKTRNCEGVTLKTIKNQNGPPQNIKGVQNNCITITQCPKSPQIDSALKTCSSKKVSCTSRDLIQEAKAAKKSQHEATDTVIITPIRVGDLPHGFKIRSSPTNSTEMDFTSKRKKSLHETHSIINCTSKIKKRKLSHEENLLSKHKRTKNEESIIIIDSDREETCRNESKDVNGVEAPTLKTIKNQNELNKSWRPQNIKGAVSIEDVDNFQLKKKERTEKIGGESQTTISKKKKHFQTARQTFAKLKHDASNNVERIKNNVKVRTEEFIKSKQDGLEFTPMIKINSEANADKKSTTVSIDGNKLMTSKARDQESKQSKTGISSIKKNFSQAEILEGITKEKSAIKKSDVSFDKKEIPTRLPPTQTQQESVVQKSLVRTSIINFFINKNSLREQCTKSKLKVSEPFEKSECTLHSGEKVITTKDDCILKPSDITGTNLEHSQLNKPDGNDGKNHAAGMGFVQQIQGLKVKHHLTPEEYVVEVRAVNKMDIPSVFKSFYTYVTKQQILQQVNPISFKLFLELFNNGGLRNFYRKYIDYQKKHEVV